MTIKLIGLITAFYIYIHISITHVWMLQVIEFSELDKPKVKFLRQVLHKLLMDTEPEEIAMVFQR